MMHTIPFLYLFRRATFYWSLKVIKSKRKCDFFHEAVCGYAYIFSADFIVISCEFLYVVPMAYFVRGKSTGECSSMDFCVFRVLFDSVVLGWQP